ncbi:hypothetical protein D1AOALGA4SA_2210 [Olavius algarvensis Delta 1 endosymbiont]|nr:hypothetical protein D1AOALGA4SA_2210 [Olavius algarvensis Delta 1 endosymbiont]
MRVARCGLRDASCGLRDADCGLRVAGCEVRAWGGAHDNGAAFGFRYSVFGNIVQW